MPAHRLEFLGSPLDAITTQQTVAMALEAMHSRAKLTHVALNVAKLVNMQANSILRNDVRSADIIGVDGMGILWGARLLGFDIPERVSGIDLMDAILGKCASTGYRPFFLGGTLEVVTAAVRAAQQTHDGLHFAGFHHGYFLDEEISNVIKEINYSRADCLFVGMPTPRKENFLAKYRSVIDAPFVMGVGGSFDVLAGKVDRAPHWLRTSGFEWLFRLLQEPRRLFWRYVSTNSKFLILVMQAIFKAMRTVR